MSRAGTLFALTPLAGLLGLLLLPPFAQAAKPRTQEEAEARLHKDITFLASPLCEGRGPTTRGINRAADFIASQFKQIGLLPGCKNDYFQPFGITGAIGSLTLTGPRGQRIDLEQNLHFLALGHDQQGKATGEVVFAGYGLSCTNPAYDDYAKLDVTGKIVAILRDTPRAGSPDRPKEMVAGAPFATKLALALKKGAAGVLLVNDAETAEDGDAPLDFSYTSIMRGAKRPPTLAVRRSVLEAMLPPGQTLVSIEQGIDRDLKPASMPLLGWTATLDVEKKADAVKLKNVVGVLEGQGPLAKETVVVGAHYDHLGYGGPSSLQPGKKRAIHHGADDNGSGTTALLELARRFASMPNPPARRMVFIAFSGEELGLFGSAHYCKEPAFPLAETACMFNLDMVGRLRKDEKTGLFRALTEGHGTAKPFKELIDNLAKQHGFVLSSKESGFGPSDHASFAGKKIPVLFFWTGTHPDYHKPSDTADKINIEGMRRIVDMSQDALLTLTKMEKPAYIEVKGSTTGRPSKGPTLGVRPGYDDNVKGLKVEGVIAGRPAEKGGVKDGDVIVNIAGKAVTDINTYMNAMSVQKAGSTIEIAILRQGKEMKLKVKLD